MFETRKRKIQKVVFKPSTFLYINSQDFSCSHKGLNLETSAFSFPNGDNQTFQPKVVENTPLGLFLSYCTVGLYRGDRPAFSEKHRGKLKRLRKKPPRSSR